MPNFSDLKFILTKKILAWNLLDPNFVWSQTYFEPKSFFGPKIYWTHYFSVPNYFGFKISWTNIFSPKNLFGLKNFEIKVLLPPRIFWPKISFDPRNLLTQPETFWPNFLEPNLFSWIKNFFSTQNLFNPIFFTNIFWTDIFMDPNFFGHRIFLTQELFWNQKNWNSVSWFLGSKICWIKNLLIYSWLISSEFQIKFENRYQESLAQIVFAV